MHLTYHIATTVQPGVDENSIFLCLQKNAAINGCSVSSTRGALWPQSRGREIVYIVRSILVGADAQEAGIALSLKCFF
jgi:hypothetical protein